MKKFSVKAVALAASFIASGAAFAANQDLDGDASPAKYASEIKVNATAGTELLNGAAAVQLADVALGASFGDNVTAYVRFDLTSGKFGADPAFAIKDSANASAVVTVSAGGAGSSYVVFAVTPTAGKRLLGANVGTLTPDATHGIVVKDQSAISIQYRLFETLTAAANPSSTNTLKDTGSVSYIAFTKALKTSFVAATQTADVEATPSYTAFTGGGTKKKLADVAITLSGAAKADGSALNAAAVASLLADKTVITVTGDFTGLKKASEADYATGKSRLTLETTDCGGSPVSATTLSGTAATFGNGSDHLTTAEVLAAKSLCYTPAGVEIQASTYSADVAYVSADSAAYAVSNVTGLAAGTIIRNGTVLVAPITNQPAGWYSRLVLNNTGTTDRTYTVKAVSEAGNVITLSGAAAGGTLAKNTSVVVDLQNVVTAVGGLPRYSLVVTTNAPSGTVNGAYQIANGTTGMISNYALIAK